MKESIIWVESHSLRESSMTEKFMLWKMIRNLCCKTRGRRNAPWVPKRVQRVIRHRKHYPDLKLPGLLQRVKPICIHFICTRASFNGKGTSSCACFTKAGSANERKVRFQYNSALWRNQWTWNISPALSWQCPHTSLSWADTTAAKRTRGACQFALALTEGLQTQMPSCWECHERSSSALQGPFPGRHPGTNSRLGQGRGNHPTKGASTGGGWYKRE